MFSSKLYQRAANSDTFFMPSVIHQNSLTCPVALKGNTAQIKNLYRAQSSSDQYSQSQYDSIVLHYFFQPTQPCSTLSCYFSYRLVVRDKQTQSQSSCTDNNWATALCTEGF